MKFVLSRSLLSISAYRYPLLAFDVKKTVVSPRKLTHLCIHGMGYELSFVRSLSLLLSTQTAVFRLFRSKDDECCSFSLRWLYKFLRGHFVESDFFKLLRLRSRTIRRRVDGLYVIIEEFNTVFCDVYATKVAVSHCLKF